MEITYIKFTFIESVGAKMINLYFMMFSDPTNMLFVLTVVSVYFSINFYLFATCKINSR
jgi:hypothetical protein